MELPSSDDQCDVAELDSYVNIAFFETGESSGEKLSLP